VGLAVSDKAATGSRRTVAKSSSSFMTVPVRCLPR
jgi:hypothetical protein